MFSCIIRLVLYDYSIFLCVPSTHKVVGISTVSRTEHTTAQTRELECIRRVLPQVMERGKKYMCMPKTIIRLYIHMFVLDIQCVLVLHDCFAFLV